MTKEGVVFSFIRTRDDRPFIFFKFSLLALNWERRIHVNDVCKHLRINIKCINSPLKEESTAKTL